MKKDIMNTLEEKDLTLQGIDVTLNGKGISFYAETWFDVDKKFGLNTTTDDDTWVNVYVEYYPFANNLQDSIKVIYDIDTPQEIISKEYSPYYEELQLLVKMMKEACMKETNMSPCEYIFV